MQIQGDPSICADYCRYTLSPQHIQNHVGICYCHLGWHTLVLKWNKNNYVSNMLRENTTEKQTSAWLATLFSYIIQIDRPYLALSWTEQAAAALARAAPIIRVCTHMWEKKVLCSRAKSSKRAGGNSQRLMKNKFFPSRKQNLSYLSLPCLLTCKGRLFALSCILHDLLLKLAGECCLNLGVCVAWA